MDHLKIMKIMKIYRQDVGMESDIEKCLWKMTHNGISRTTKSSSNQNAWRKGNQRYWKLTSSNKWKRKNKFKRVSQKNQKVTRDNTL